MVQRRFLSMCVLLTSLTACRSGGVVVPAPDARRSMVEPCGPAGSKVAPDPGAAPPQADPRLAGVTHRFFKISVVDAVTRAPIAGARLLTTNQIALVSDRNGLVAFYEPGLMDTDVHFMATRAGYEIAPDGFGIRGKVLRPAE